MKYQDVFIIFLYLNNIIILFKYNNIMKISIIMYILIMILIIIIKPGFIYDKKNKIEEKKLYIIGICVAIMCGILLKNKTNNF